MPKGKLLPEGEVIAAYGAAMVAAFQVLINCLEENGAVEPRQFPDALGVYMEMVKSSKGAVSDVTLAVLRDIRTATLTQISLQTQANPWLPKSLQMADSGEFVGIVAS